MNLRNARPHRYTYMPGRARGPGPLHVGMTFVLVLALLAGCGYGAQSLLYKVWDRVVGYSSPYTRPLPFGDIAVPALSESVVLFVVDGLRVDASRGMPNLSSLRDGATNLIALAEQPSLSLPGGAVLGTGAPPVVHGVTTNWYEGPIAIDSMFAAARRAGVPTAFFGWDGWTGLYGAHLDRSAAPAADKDAAGVHDLAVRDLAREHLLAAGGRPAGLTVVYFSGTDDKGHAFGGASPEYLAETLIVDGYLGELLSLLDLTYTTVLVTADHGHVDAGGHGGWEPAVLEIPLVLAGRGIVRPAAGGTGAADGDWPIVRQMDVAPTITALLGAGVPTHALGTHLADWLQATAAWQAARAVAAAAARARLSPLLTGLGRGADTLPAAVTTARERLEAGRYDEARQMADGFMQEERAERERAQSAGLASRRAGRLAKAAAYALLPLLLLALMAKPPRLWGPVLGAALFFVLFYGVYSWARGLSYSFSAFNSEYQIKAFITMRLLEGAALVTVAGLVGAWICRDLDIGLRTTAGLGALWTATLVMYGLGLYMAWFYYQQGLSYPDYLPDLRAGFKALVYLLTAAGAGFAAVPSVGLAVVVGGLGSARRSSRAVWRPR